MKDEKKTMDVNAAAGAASQSRPKYNGLENPWVVAKCHDMIRSLSRPLSFRKSSFSIGRFPFSDVAFEAPFLPEYVASVRRDGGKWNLTVVEDGFIEINGVLLKKGNVVELERKTLLKIRPAFEVEIEFLRYESETLDERQARLDKESIDFAQKVHTEFLERMRNRGVGYLDNVDKNNVGEDVIGFVENEIDDIAGRLGLYSDPDDRSEENVELSISDATDLVRYMAGLSIRDEMSRQLFDASDRGNGGQQEKNDVAGLFDEKNKRYSRFCTVVPSYERKLTEWGKGYVDNLLASAEMKMDSVRKDGDGGVLTEAFDVIDKTFWGKFLRYVDKNGSNSVDFLRYLARRYLTKTIKDSLFGYGPLEDLLRTPTITEIMVVDYKTIFIEKSGRLENSGRRFFSEEVTQDVINRIVTKVNRTIDKSRPLVDARLSDGSRVNAIIDPIAVSGACLTIRRFPEKRLTVDELVTNPRIRSLTPAAAEFLRASILARKNILISGGTGTGKTTLLNCLCDYIPDGERIVTIEDTVELRIAKQHVVRLEAKPANAEGAGAYTIRDLVKNALRMRPDRIIVGECRGGEALDMLQAMNTGHDGSLTTIHANSAEDAILRLETLVLQSDAKMPVDSIDRQIVSAIDLIVQLKRMRNGRRCVSQIVEVTHLDPETGEFVTREIFNLDSETSDYAVLSPTGSLPSYMNVLLAKKYLDLKKFYFD